jgi:predicted nucleic acid-binding protein
VSFLLDTNVVSELRRGPKADAKVLHWARSVAASDMWLSVITILELELGVLRIARQDPQQADVLRRWLDQRVLTEFGPRILPVDIIVARRCAGLHVPDPRSERDALIAATALVHGSVVVTRNVVDFAPTGVALLDPWA